MLKCYFYFMCIKLYLFIYILYYKYRYNTLRIKTHRIELKMIIKEIENIENLINNSQELVTWQSEGK